MTARELTVREAAELLKEQDNILVVCHAHPDGDAVGSGVALERMLTVLGKTAYLVCADTVPHQLRFLLGYRPCGRDGDADALRPELLPEEFSPSFIVTVDVASIELTGMAERLEGKVDLKIDHHSMGGDFAPLSLMYRGSSACGEVIYDLAEQLGLLDIEAASALYAAVSSDSGSFRFDSVTPDTIMRVYGMMRLGIDHSYIAEQLYNSRTQAEMAAQRVALNNLEYFAGGRIAITHISFADFERGEFTYADTGSLNAMPIMIDGVELSLVAKEERAGHYRVSTRSRRGIAANKFCARFGGGGHDRAAGMSADAASYEVLRNTLIAAALEIFDFDA